MNTMAIGDGGAAVGCGGEGMVEEARRRLEAILADKVLRFNPYGVGDEALVACAERGRWRPFPALTQMVVFHFLDIREVMTHHRFDAIFFRVGDSADEHYFPLGNLINPIYHHAHKKPVRTQINGKNITRSNIVRLQNRSFFVSHAISGSRFYPDKLAYQMARLKGSVSKQADIIRQQMCLSKVAMLEEVLNYPQSSCYLGPVSTGFDYATPIRAALQSIAQYPSARR